MGHDNSIYAVGSQKVDSTGQDGLVVKLEPEIIGPMFAYYLPEDTLLTLLPGDTTQFIVRAVNQMGSEMSYLWLLDSVAVEDLNDTTLTVNFDELGEYEVECRVSDDDWTSVIRWQVEVTDLYIDAHLPNSLTIPTRRNSAIDFSISARAVADDPIGYTWLLNDEQIADDDSVSIRFERGREHSVTAVASQGELSDSVTWQVIVNDLIVDYLPEQFDLSVPIDTTFEFEVFPFDENDDSLRFLWTVNGDSISSRSWLLKNFDEEGVYNTTAYVSDTTESDSLTWEVTVQPNSIHTDAPRHPDTTTLQAPVPNPFNSQTRIRCSLPIEGRIDLGLYDISGRRVETLYSGVRSAGVWNATIDGSELSSGVYFVSLVGDDIQLFRKVVLIK